MDFRDKSDSSDPWKLSLHLEHTENLTLHPGHPARYKSTWQMRKDASKPCSFAFWLDSALDAFLNILGATLDTFCTFKHWGFIDILKWFPFSKILTLQGCDLGQHDQRHLGWCHCLKPAHSNDLRGIVMLPPSFGNGWVKLSSCYHFFQIVVLILTPN